MAEARDTVIQLDQNEEDLVTILTKEIQDCGDGLLLSECCIYRVPIVLRQLEEESYSPYTPKVVSIGPFHHGEDGLQDMESHKQIMFKRFTQRAKSSLDDLVRCVKDLEPEVRASYSETIDLNEQELVKLILMDACFIIEFFIMFSKMKEKKEVHNDVKLSQPCLVISIMKDLILLENQLPFFVIEKLFNEAFPNNNRGDLPSFRGLACKVFKYITQKLELNPEAEIKHFTDLIRWSYLQEKKTERHSSSEAQKHILRYNANALQEAGIKLIPNQSNCLSDLKFSGHTLEISQIGVDDSTQILFCNMIALEQCVYPTASYITEYTAVMDWLIDTNKDVDILVHNKIVSNNLGDSENVASLFNGLLEDVTHISFNSEYLDDFCKKLNDYCEDPCQKRMATLRRDYCNTPWRTVASIAGIILLLLTIVQTIFSILQVVL